MTLCNLKFSTELLTTEFGVAQNLELLFEVLHEGLIQIRIIILCTAPDSVSKSSLDNLRAIIIFLFSQY